MNKRDWFLLLGILSVAAGAVIQFGLGWGAIAFGSILLLFGVLAGGDT